MSSFGIFTKMPFATFTRVREVSSEDSIHLAENLIKNEPNKKWKTKNGGEKSAYVIIEMIDSYQITGIDIGNEHSAFVEVLVGKSACAPEEFKEILITFSVMTPIESKSSKNTNRVRCFNRDAFVPNIGEEKWSLVKILCTQPFNKHVQYGLSFIKVHINDNIKNPSTAVKTHVPDQILKKSIQVIGKFKFREDSPDSDSDNKCSSLFNRWKKSKHNNEPTTSASIRTSSKNLNTLTPFSSTDNQQPKSFLSAKKDDNIRDRIRENLSFGDQADAANKKLERFPIQIKPDKRKFLIERENDTKNNKSKPPDSVSKNLDIVPIKPSNSIYKTKRKSLSPEHSDKKMKSKKYRPLNELLKGVVLVISGIQNPDREILRNKAIALGAKYKSDWDSSCTHLICAFKGTPKYNQVKGKGKIVTRSWIENCYISKKYEPWRRYALDSNELAQLESDDEVFADTENFAKEISNNNFQNTSSISVGQSQERSETVLDIYAIDEKLQQCYHNGVSSESDTDDEIKRVEQSIKAVKTNATPKTVDIYEVSTDEEEYIIEKRSQFI